MRKKKHNSVEQMRELYKMSKLSSKKMRYEGSEAGEVEWSELKKSCDLNSFIKSILW